MPSGKEYGAGLNYNRKHYANAATRKAANNAAKRVKQASNIAHPKKHMKTAKRTRRSARK
jgi:hypothetical protein